MEQPVVRGLVILVNCCAPLDHRSALLPYSVDRHCLPLLVLDAGVQERAVDGMDYAKVVFRFVQRLLDQSPCRIDYCVDAPHEAVMLVLFFRQQFRQAAALIVGPLEQLLLAGLSKSICNQSVFVFQRETDSSLFPLRFSTP